MKKLLPLLLMTALAAACSEIPRGAYFNRGTPESLLDMSSEVVSIALSDVTAVEEMTGWVNREQPSRAELSCRASDPLCLRAGQALDQFGVPYETAQQDRGTVSLYYERVLARDCENRFIDAPYNPYNLNYPSFGCSISANMVQQVTDKRQFINPSLLDYTDGEKTVQVYRAYAEPPDGKKDRNSSSLLKGGSK